MPIDMNGLPLWAVIAILIFRVFFAKGGGSPTPIPAPTPGPVPADGGLLQRILDGINRLNGILPNVVPRLPSPQPPAAAFAATTESPGATAPPIADPPAASPGPAPAAKTVWLPIEMKIGAPTTN